jgi:hypothetical protein
MLIASIPTKIDIVWASGAGGSAIRVIPDSSSDPNAASWTLGWPPNTAVDPGAGGDPPDWRDFNGMPNMLSAWTQWQNAGAPVFYDAAFSSSVGGYPKYAMLANASTVGQFWISQVDNNTSDPDTGGANWLAFPQTIGGYVSSFNARTGAVVLSSTDVVNALAANALPLAKIAQAPGLTLLGNATGGAATSSWLAIAAILGLLGQTGLLANPGYFTVPIVTTGGALVNVIVNFGFQSPQGPVTFAKSFTTPIAPGVNAIALTTANFTVPTNYENLTLTGMNVYAGSGAGISWIAIGY